MSRIAETFASLRSAGRTAFMPYLMAGDPDLATTRRLMLAMSQAGADLIELGVPFSDPMADGPTNQLASERALASGTTLTGILQMLADFRKESQTPVLLMGYLNPFLRYGLEKLCRDASAAGADGFIIPDLQPDDVGEIRPHADACGLDTVFLAAPTSTPERLAHVAQESRGFIYMVSLTGVTGMRDTLPPGLAEFLERTRQHTKLPLAVGFGIGTPAMAAAVGRIADGVIVGSAIVKRIAAAAEAGTDPVPPVEDLVHEMRAALDAKA